MDPKSPAFSIFAEYYQDQKFEDRFARDPRGAVTVIIPTVHTNELWRTNLISIYREIPVAELLLGDGGCIDDTVKIASEFPRVQIHDHRSYVSLGYSIRKLIESVKTEWFIYLHSDVYLPAGWFDKMQAEQKNYDWFGCRMRHTVMVEYDLSYGPRPYAGSQMGKTAAFSEGLKNIDDDYVYRQEDFVFSDIVKRSGGKEGFIDHVHHYHQTMRKPSPSGRQVEDVKIKLSMNPEEETRSWTMQLRGIVKYFDPEIPWLKDSAISSAIKLIEKKSSTKGEIKDWIMHTNPKWWPVIRKGIFKRTFAKKMYAAAKSILKKLGLK